MKRSYTAEDIQRFLDKDDVIETKGKEKKYCDGCKEELGEAEALFWNICRKCTVKRHKKVIGRK